MLDAIIIFSFILAAAGLGFYSTDLLPEATLSRVSNLDALRFVVAVFAAIIGGAFGLRIQTGYRRLEAQVRDLPLEVIVTRAIGLIMGLLVANLMLAPLFLLPIPPRF